MLSATAATPSREPTPERALNLYRRAVWKRLSAGAFSAALAAWLVAMLPPLRAAIVIERNDASLGLTLVGVSLVAAPFITWALARVFARGPSIINPFWYWLFVIAAGAAANTLAVLYLRDSVVSVFVLAGLSSGAIALAHRIVAAPPLWACLLLFVATGLGGEWIINTVLKGSWPFTALDLSAIALFAVLIACRGGAFDRIRQAMTHSGIASGATFAAMHLITLANAPARIERRAARDPVIRATAPAPPPTMAPPAHAEIKREEAQT